jgi:hypothetical protein
LENFFAEGQPQVGFFIVGIQLDTFFGVFNGEAVVLEFDLREGPVGVVDGNFVIGNGSPSAMLDSF